jgi:hypothetical protein
LIARVAYFGQFGDVPAAGILHTIFGFSETTVDILGVAGHLHDPLIG